MFRRHAIALWVPSRHEPGGARRAGRVALVVALTAACVVLPGQRRADAAPDPRAWTAYVASNQINVAGIVTPIDTATNTAGPGIPVGAVVVDPFGIAITPDATTAYVTERGSDQVIRIDTATNELVGAPIPVGDFPTYIAITPNGRTAYVVNRLSDSVTPIDIVTNTAGPAIPVGDFPDGIAITPDGTTAYVILRGSPGTPAQVVPINVATNTVGTPVILDAATSRVMGIAITPDGTTAYITDVTPDSVIPFTIATGTVGTRIPIDVPVVVGGPEPTGIAITPDGTTAFTADQRGAASTVTPIDLASNTALAPIVSGAAPPPAASPFDLAITPDGRFAYVANAGQDSISVIDTATRTVVAGPIPVGDGPDTVAITPDQAPVAHVSTAAATSGCTATLDASASTVTFGTIASFAWDFGDGQTATTATATTGHTYAQPGTYPVTVTETSSGGTSIPAITPDIFTGQTMSRNADDHARTTASVVVPAPCVAPLPATGAGLGRIGLAGLAAIATGIALLLYTGIRRRYRRPGR